jgi:hypothetical protein
VLSVPGGGCEEISTIPSVWLVLPGRHLGRQQCGR